MRSSQSPQRFVSFALGLVPLGSFGAAPSHAACVGTTTECRDGRFTDPFAEPTVLGVTTSEKCVTDTDGQLACKPAAATLALLPDDRLIYFNALEGTENVELSIVAEFGIVSANDQTRVLSFNAAGVPSWTRPTPVDAGANPDGHDPNALPGVPVVNGGADGALFCSDVVFLADGRLLAAGGTDYYLEPGVPLIPYGVSELEGLSVRLPAAVRRDRVGRGRVRDPRVGVPRAAAHAPARVDVVARARRRAAARRPRAGPVSRERAFSRSPRNQGEVRS